MKITDFNPLRGSAAAKRKKEASGSTGFLDFLGDNSTEEVNNAPPVDAPMDAGPISSMSALLSLQEIPEDEVRKKKALMHSAATLEALEELRHAMLFGAVPVNVLRQIGELLAEKRQELDDPRLISIMDDIELRAAVELAKYEQAQTTPE